jgi:hypothetical protein
MLPVIRCAVLASLWLIASQANAQIYTCVAEDGTRVFSDEKCGPDAKVVPGITTKKRTQPGESRGKPDRTVRPPEELDQLLRECNEGDMKACMDARRRSESVARAGAAGRACVRWRFARRLRTALLLRWNHRRMSAARVGGGEDYGRDLVLALTTLLRAGRHDV